MSWAVEEWKDGLSGKALQKIQEFESQLDKLKKERQQKQFQLDSLEAALQKQKQKFDSEKSEASAIKRENQSLVESCDNLEKARLKLSHDLQIKEQQVNFLEGQLNACRKQIERLEQELKKSKNDLDRSHCSTNSDLQVYSTPQKTFAVPATPNCRQTDSKFEELQEKFNNEVEERKRLEAELKVLQIKLLNQSSVSHKDIARQQQAGSSIFPWQQEQTPSKRRNGPGVSMWNAAEETPVRQRPQTSTRAIGEAPGNSQQAEQLKALNQDLKIKVTELEHRLQTQEKDLKSQMNKFIETQSHLDKAKRDFVEKEKSLNKYKEDLAKMTTQHEQGVTKCASVEQKLKQVTEEMNCQRHNFDSTRRALEQKLKDQEKDFQKELANLQSSHRDLDQQFSQTKTKMGQEIQQAKKECNMLQSEVDKITALKNRLDKDLEEQKQKLFKSEQGLQVSQTREAELKKKCDEMQRENNNISGQLQQGTRRLNQLEEDKKNSEQGLKQSRNMVEDLKAKSEAQNEELKTLHKKLENQSQTSSQEMDHLKKALCGLEMKEKSCQEDLTKYKQEVSQLQNQLQIYEKEKHDLKVLAESRGKDIEELKQEYEKIVAWRTEKSQLIENTEADRNAMQSTIDELEKTSTKLGVENESLQQMLQNQNREKQCEIDSLKGELLNKCMELEERGRIHEEMVFKHQEADQKHAKDIENNKAQIETLQDQVKTLELRLKEETKELERMMQSHTDVLAQYESTCDLVKSKDAIIELNEKKMAHLQEIASQSTALQEELLKKCEEEKVAIVKQCEESLALKANEAEQVKLNLIKSEQEVVLMQGQVTSLESVLKLQKGLSGELQAKQEEHLKANKELTEKLSEAQNRERHLMNEVKQLSDQVNGLNALQDQCTEFATAAEKSRQDLVGLKEVHQQTVEELQAQKLALEKYDIQISHALNSVACLEKENSELTEDLEKIRRERHELTSKFETISDAYSTICEENTNLHKKNLEMSAELEQKSEFEESLVTVKAELQASHVLSSELQNTVESLQKQLDVVLDQNSHLETSLKEKNDQIVSFETSVKESSDKFNQAIEGHVAEMEKHLQKHKNLKEQLELAKGQLRVKCQETEENLSQCFTEISHIKEERDQASNKLKEVSEAFDQAKQQVSDLMQSASLHAQELEKYNVALETHKRSEEEKNSEIQKLKKQLDESELEKTKSAEALKEKNVNMNKIKVQLEMLQMDLEDNEACMSTYDSQIEELKGTVSQLEDKLDKSEGQRCKLEDELTTAQDQLSTKTSEMSHLTASLEDVYEKQQNNAALTSELQNLKASSEGLKVALEAEVCKRTNIETVYNNLMEQKHKVDKDLLETQRDYQNNLEELDVLKQKNEGLQEVIQNLTVETQTLRAALEQSDQQLDNTELKNKEFEKEHVKLCQQLAALETEHSEVNDKYCHLMSLVMEQQATIEQFQESNGVSQDHSIPKQTTDDQILETCAESSQERPLATVPDPCLEVGIKLVEEQVGADVTNVSIEGQLEAKSRELEALSNAFEEAVRTLEEQREAEVEQLKLKHSSEVERLQQTMDIVKLDLESKLVGERQNTEILSSQLEVARLQMEELNLASQSLLGDLEHIRQQSATPVDSVDDQNEKDPKGEDCDDGEFYDAPGSPDQSFLPEPSDEGVADNITKMTPDTPKHRSISLAELQTSNDMIQRQAEELQELHAQYELLIAEMAVRKDLSKDLETKVHDLEEERAESLNKWSSAQSEKQVLCTRVETMAEEISSLTLQLQTSNAQLSDVLEMVESLEHAKGGWDEKFLQIESELKRSRSDKANLERHILSMEVDLESMQEQKQRLETEVESSRKAVMSLEQELQKALTESGQLKQELFLYSEEREADGQSLKKFKERAEILEKNNTDTRELVKILEEDIHTGRKELEQASHKMNALVIEKEKLIEQTQVLQQNIASLNEEKQLLSSELAQLKDGENLVLRESENMGSKIHTLQDDNLKLSQSLESSLLEKGEIAARLISTQEEVSQMRAGIEKLKVRIESDERKKKHMSQLLREAQMKADSLQDNIERLEREKEISDQNLEEAVLQAEMAKAELEELDVEKKALSEKIHELTIQLNNLREERDNLEKGLLQKIEEMHLSMQEVSLKLANAEQASKDAEVHQKSVVDELQSRLCSIEGELQKSRDELEATRLKDQNASQELLSLQKEHEELRLGLENALKLQVSLQSANECLQNELTSKWQELTAKEEENQKLGSELIELHGLMKEKQIIEELNEQLKISAAEWQEKANVELAKNETFQVSITSLQNSIKELESQLQATVVANGELSGEINILQESKLNLQNQLERSTHEANELLQQNLDTLKVQLEESKGEALGFKLSMDTLAAEREELMRDLAGIQASLVKMKAQEIRQEDALRQAQQQHEETLRVAREETATAQSKATQLLSDISSLRTREQELTSALSALHNQQDLCKPTQDELSAKIAKLSKERDSLYSKMNLWMKSCKQLENEKQALVEEGQKRDQLIASLKDSHSQGEVAASGDDLKAELEELRETLEERSKEADESMDRCCSLMVKVHKLEEANERLQNKLRQLSSQPPAGKGRRSGAAKAEAENTKPTSMESLEGPSASKRPRALANTPIKAQEALENLTKRLKAGVTPKMEEEEFCPEGLPERVMKGFADIPKGEMSPFIMRRTTVQRCSPRLAAQRSLAAQQMALSAGPSPTCSPKLPVEDSSLQESLPGSQTSILSSMTNSPRARHPEVTGVSKDQRKSRRSSCTRRTSGQKDLPPQPATPAKQEDNCHVQ